MSTRNNKKSKINDKEDESLENNENGANLSKKLKTNETDDEVLLSTENGTNKENSNGIKNITV
jgi:hypothetical protein